MFSQTRRPPPVQPRQGFHKSSFLRHVILLQVFGRDSSERRIGSQRMIHGQLDMPYLLTPVWVGEKILH
jgi:hypothetical protein